MNMLHFGKDLKPTFKKPLNLLAGGFFSWAELSMIVRFGLARGVAIHGIRLL